MLFDVQLLMENNRVATRYKIKVKNKKYIYTMCDANLGFMAIWRFIQFVNAMTVNLPIVIRLDRVKIIDKLSYVLLECICQYLIEKRNMRISMSIRAKKNIFVAGIASSPLNILSRQSTKKNCEEYLRKFQSEIYQGHYRKLVGVDENHTGIAASKISSEIETFLKTFQIEQEYINDVTEVIGELIDNGLEHSETDCLIDVDVTPNYTKSGDPNGVYYGVNIVILSMSEILIGDKVKQVYEKIGENKWFNKLRIAYSNHSKFWDEQYVEDDFFAMAAFQHRITGRSVNSNTGGTGLTHLISVLESKSDAYNCYMVSGHRMLRFQQALLKQDDSEWVGFNAEHDFVNSPPQKNNFVKSPLFFPGVAYNLNFVLKKEKDNEQ